MSNTRAAVARRAENVGQVQQQNGRQQTPPIILQVEALKPQIARALPPGMDADQMVRAVITTMRKTPDLIGCSVESMLGAVMTCAQLGMMPGPQGEVWLIPRKGQAEFQLGYQGMVSLFWRHPQAAGLTTMTVHEGDNFEYEEGLHATLRHTPADTPSGKPIAYYAIARTAGGGVVWKVMYPWQIEKHRQRSSAPNSPAWRNDFDGMAHKTCIRMLFKVLPKTAETGRALAHDGTVRTDTAPDAIDAPMYRGDEQPPALPPGQGQPNEPDPNFPPDDITP